MREISSRRVTASGTVSRWPGEVRVGELGAGVEGGVEDLHHGLLELGAAELLGPRGEPGEVEALRGAAAPGEVDAEDLLALGGVGQVDEEDLVEATLAQQLRREPSTRLAVATTNTGAVFSWSQVRKVPSTRGGGAAVAHVRGGRAGERLVDLVQPEHRGGSALGDADGAGGGSPRSSPPAR
jgi:hypothetical protein